jgi:N,N'-diacetyllegionaminate synthase
MNKTLVIAEAGVNHNGDIELAKRLIEVAAEAGADYVKFQTFKSEEALTNHANQAEYQLRNTGQKETQLDMVRRLELSEDAHFELIAHAKKCGIKFFSTAFDLQSLAFLNALGIDMFKIPSGEITNYPYLCAVARYRKPIILSTGMSTLGEIESAIKVLVENGTDIAKLTVLHCTTEYPAPVDEVNLNVIATLRQAFGTRVGYSDHTLGISVPVAAVALGACVIEKHITLDRNMSGPDHRASLLPDELKSMVAAIRQVELALGDGIKRVTPSEKKNLVVARKSLVARVAIKQGDFFTKENITAKRPGSGLNPMRYEEVIGKQAKKDFFPDDFIEL